MSDLQPKGTPVTVNGQERHILLTLNVIDEIQNEFKEITREGEIVEDPNLLEIFVYVFEQNAKLKDYKDLCKLTAMLLNDETERNKRLGGEQFEKITAEDLGYILTLEDVNNITRAIMDAYGISMPEPDDDDDSPNPMSGQNS